MLRRQFFIREDQDEFVRNLQGNDSEHVRHAIDDYVKRIKLERSLVQVSTSKS